MEMAMGDVRRAWCRVKEVLRRAFRAHFMLDHVDTDQDWIDRGW